MSVYNLATPRCVQSRPISVNMCPSASDLPLCQPTLAKEGHETHLVIVPSISDTTTLSVCSHKKMRAAHATTPDEASEKVIVFAPGRRSSACCDVTCK